MSYRTCSITNSMFPFWYNLEWLSKEKLERRTRESFASGRGGNRSIVTFCFKKGPVWPLFAGKSFYWKESKETKENSNFPLKHHAVKITTKGKLEAPCNYLHMLFRLTFVTGSYAEWRVSTKHVSLFIWIECLNNKSTSLEALIGLIISAPNILLCHNTLQAALLKIENCL